MSPRKRDIHSSSGACRFAAEFILGLWIITACLASAAALFGQKVKSDVTILDDLFFNELKNLIMPKNAVELGQGPSLNIPGTPAPRRMTTDPRREFLFLRSKKSRRA